MEKFGKTAVFPGGYGRIGEIPHRYLVSTTYFKMLASRGPFFLTTSVRSGDACTESTGV